MKSNLHGFRRDLDSRQQKINKHSESELAGLYQLYISENQDSNGNWHEDPWTRSGAVYIVNNGQGCILVQLR